LLPRKYLPAALKRRSKMPLSRRPRTNLCKTIRRIPPLTVGRRLPIPAGDEADGVYIRSGRHAWAARHALANCSRGAEEHKRHLGEEIEVRTFIFGRAHCVQ